MFADKATIYVRGGDGGAGCVSFRREKFAPRGGPDGGDGGKGGDVLIQANKKLTSLYDLVSRTHFRAAGGKRGQGQGRHGKSGADAIIQVPVGTIVGDQRIGSVLKDLTGDGEIVVIARGGKGGRGNARFASSSNRTPTFAEEGEPGQERWLELELKILADVGIIGLPNAGKSTLLSRISNARPKIAEYPFTTLEVALGVAEGPEYSFILVADIPGLIEGAHSGRGLGYEFLRHIERALLLVHVVDMASEGGNSPFEAYRTVRREMEQYNPILLEKSEIVVCNKMDLEGARENLASFTKAISAQFFPISALSGEGVEQLMEELVARLERIKEPSPSF